MLGKSLNTQLFEFVEIHTLASIAKRIFGSRFDLCAFNYDRWNFKTVLNFRIKGFKKKVNEESCNDVKYAYFVLFFCTDLFSMKYELIIIRIDHLWYVLENLKNRSFLVG